MTLDISAIAGQIRAMAEGLDGNHDRDRFDALASAWDNLDITDLNLRLLDAKTLFFHPRESPNISERIRLPQPIDDYTVVATDGSFILPSRHHPARFWILNIGTVILHYGVEPGARMTSNPTMYHKEEDLYLPDNVHRTPVNGALLSPKRAADELIAVVDALESVDAPVVGLQDGTLILWGLDSMPTAVNEWALQPFLAALGRAKAINKPIASYISAPAASEIFNLLRISVCDYPASGRNVDCHHCRGRIASEGHAPACDILPQVSDKWLMRELADLQPGERTPPFRSASNALGPYDAVDPDLHIYFFYMHNGWEIGRVEVPKWVAEDLEQLELVHWTLHDQSTLGLGYPLALQEAHELAVLSMADRRMVEDAVERALAEAGITLTYHGKAGSKRVRAI